MGFNILPGVEVDDCPLEHIYLIPEFFLFDFHIVQEFCSLFLQFFFPFINKFVQLFGTTKNDPSFVKLVFAKAVVEAF